MTLANFGGAQNFAIDSVADAARKSRRSNSPLISAQLVANLYTAHSEHPMAKRKSERDPEDLPDAPEKRTQQDGDDSGSDEVCASVDYSSCNTAS